MILRALIVLLVALNAGALAWAVWRPAVPDAGTERFPAGVPRLELAGATPTPGPVPQAPPTQEAPAPDPGAALEPAPTPPQVARCLRFGPFATDAALAAARSALQPLVQQLVEFQRTPPAGRGWRVYLPPQADRAAAQALVERIREAGISDYYIIAEGAEAHSIALGRYGSEQAARNRQAALLEAGFQVRAEPLEQGATQHWLDARLQPQADADAAGRVAAAAPLDCAAFGNRQGAR